MPPQRFTDQAACLYCQRIFATQRAVRRHLGRAPKCQRRLTRTIRAQSISLDVNIAVNPPFDHNSVGITLLDVPQVTHQQSRGVSIEEIEDEDDCDAPWNSERHVEAFPRPAGVPIHPHRAKTKFELLQEARTKAGQDEWAPFANKEEWELAMWLMENVGQKAADKFLKLSITRDRTNPSFHNNYTFLKKIDALPTGPDWECKIVKTTGDRQGEDGKMMEEEMELWFRNPVDCVKELIGNPAFKDHISYTPEHVFTSGNGDNRILDEMWTADWWWDTQNKLPSGATIVPIILASDKTQLSQFQGDKKAWPVYLTLGNISKEIRRRPSAHATILLGYLPVPKLDCYTDATRSLAGYRLFHYCMAQILAPLVQTGQDGVETVCADGFIRLLYIILAAYIADHPEQCLVACCMENRCPHCLVDPNLRGSLLESLERDPPSILKLLDAHRRGVEPSEFEQYGIRPVYQPFWHNLPHCDIFQCLTPDLLHQLHKGVFKDHLVKWCTDLIGSAEIDARFKAMSSHPGLRHFKKGISFVSQWTGTEHKEMEKVFLGILAGAPGTNGRIITVAHALLDFIYYAQLQTHTTKTLNALQSCLVVFHNNKDVFIELGARNHFNFPKLHSLLHYLASILSLGANDGYNSEAPERLHIDFAKDAYRASNKRDYHEQMALWLQRREAMWQQDAYLTWLNGMPHTEDNPNDLEADEFANELDDSRLTSTAMATLSPTATAPTTSIAIAATATTTPTTTITTATSTTTTMIPTILTATPTEIRVTAITSTTSTITPATETTPPPTRHQLAKVPPFRQVSINTLNADFGALNFLPTLTNFLQQHYPTCPIAPNIYDRFNLYKVVTITLPPNPYLSQQTRTSRIRATPSIPPHGRNPGSTAIFDMALIIEDPSKYQSRGGISGLRVAQVRAIFDLPPQFVCAGPLHKG